MQQSGFGGGKGERVPDKRPGKERDARFRPAFVAELPLPAVKRIQILGAAGDNADRQPAADDFAVSRHVGFDAEIGLCAARTNSKSRDDLVKDQRRASTCRDLTDFAQELRRLQVRAAALHRLDQDRRQRRRKRPQGFQSLWRAVIQDHNFLSHAAWNAGRNRHGPRPICAGQHFIKRPVVVAGKVNDFRPACHCPRRPHRRHDRFRAGVAERRPLGAGHGADHLGYFPGQRRLRPDFHPH